MFQQAPWQGPGTGSMTTHTIEIIVMLAVAFILGYLFWYLWNRQKYNKSIRTLENKNNDLHGRISRLQTDLDACRDARIRVSTSYADLERRYNAIRKEKELLERDTHAGVEKPPVGTPSFGKIFSDDNLQVIEGIGPKIERILKSSGIGTWTVLASKAPQALKEILNQAGPHYRIHNPESWPTQADLAVKKDWDSLIEYQQFLGGGSDNSDTVSSGRSKLEKLAAKLAGHTLLNSDDLKVIEGIGPKTEKLLKENGVMNWRELSMATKEELLHILRVGGPRFRLLDPTTWPEQARLAHAGDWEAFDKYKAYLIGGRDPAIH